MQSIRPKMTFFGHALRRWLLRAAVVGLVLGSLGLVVVRWFEVKRDRGLAPGVTYLSITGLSGGAE
ncbi:MAG TPA: hypothetical protein VNL70_08905, partial [Tepidisphaeraceae bacterium]|nr:hypothetical protein [Tepidisphaeraceae bacterium]